MRAAISRRSPRPPASSRRASTSRARRACRPMPGTSSAGSAARGKLRGILRPAHPGSATAAARSSPRSRRCARPASTTSPSTIGAICAARNLAWIAEALQLRRLSVEFTGKVVAITGAAGGIGRALCRYFGGEGAAIAAIDRSPAVSGVRRGTARRPASTRRRGRRCRRQRRPCRQRSPTSPPALGAVDILINNAGFSQQPDARRAPTPEGWRDDVNGNLNGAYNCAYAVLPGMKARRSGVIVNIGSVNGSRRSATRPTAPPRPG